MRRRTLFVLPLLLCTSAAYLLFRESRPALPANRFLSKRIADKVAQGDGTILRVNQLTDFTWERLHVISPYADQSEIEQQLGCTWDDYRFSSIEGNDGIALLIFTKNGRVCAWCEHPRGGGDFSKVYGSGYTTDNAIFVVKSGSPPELERHSATQSSD